MASDIAEALKTKFQEEFDLFLGDAYNINQAKLEHILKMLHARAVNEQVNTLYNNEVQDRLRIVKVLEPKLVRMAAARQETFKITPIMASFFMVLPMSKLESLERTANIPALLDHLICLRGHVHRFQRGHYTEDEKEDKRKQYSIPSSSQSQPAAHLGQRATSTASGASQASRNSKGKKRANDGSIVSQDSRIGAKEQAERSYASRRDCKKPDGNKCVVTGSTRVELCHIVPYALYNTASRQSQVKKSIPELFTYFGDTTELTELIYTHVMLDHHWNIIPLQKLIHEAWGNAECAFKFLGIYPDNDKYIVKLQFHWLNLRNFTKEAHDKFQFNFDSVSEMVGKPLYPEFPKEGGEVLRQDTTSIRTGDVFKITMPNEADAMKMKTVIDAQWVVLRIAAMSGAALDFRLSLSDTTLEPENSAIRELLEADEANEAETTMEDVAFWAKSLPWADSDDEKT